MTAAIQLLTRTQRLRFLPSALVVTSAAALLLIGLQVSGMRVSMLNAGLVYLLLTLLVSATFGARAGFAAAAVSVLVMHYLFIEPIFGFSIAEPQHFAALPVFFIGAAVGASLRDAPETIQGADERRFSPMLSGQGLRIDAAGRVVYLDGERVHLTPTEFKLLFRSPFSSPGKYTHRILF